MIKDPIWLNKAYTYLGVTEVKGPKHNSTIIRWLDELGAWYKNDEAAWCGTFIAAVFHECGYEVPSLYMRAKSWLNWGRKISKPVVGCVAILDRKGGGHVTLVVAIDREGYFYGLGGNQGDTVKVSKFPMSRVLGFRIPIGWSYVNAKALPVIASVGEISKNEA